MPETHAADVSKEEAETFLRAALEGEAFAKELAEKARSVVESGGPVMLLGMDGFLQSEINKKMRSKAIELAGFASILKPLQFIKVVAGSAGGADGPPPVCVVIGKGERHAEFVYNATETPPGPQRPL